MTDLHKIRAEIEILDIAVGAFNLHRDVLCILDANIAAAERKRQALQDINDTIDLVDEPATTKDATEHGAQGVTSKTFSRCEDCARMDRIVEGLCVCHACLKRHKVDFKIVPSKVVFSDTDSQISTLNARVQELEAALAACKVHTKDPSSRCGNRYEPENGEFVTPCHLPSGHDGEHHGYCLGSRCVWSDDASEAAEKARRDEEAK
jgi:hypothetical protein